MGGESMSGSEEFPEVQGLLDLAVLDLVVRENEGVTGGKEEITIVDAVLSSGSRDTELVLPHVAQRQRLVDREKHVQEKKAAKEKLEKRRAIRLGPPHEQEARRKAKEGGSVQTYFQSGRNPSGAWPLSWACDISAYSDPKSSSSGSQGPRHIIPAFQPSVSGNTILVGSTPPRSKPGDTILVGSTPPRSNPAVVLLGKGGDVFGKGKEVMTGPSQHSTLPFGKGKVVAAVAMTKKRGGVAFQNSSASSSDGRKEQGGVVLGDLQSLSLSEEDKDDPSSNDTDFVDAPPQRMARTSRNYERNRRYHCEWSAKFTWAEGVVESGVHFVKCRICSEVDGKPKLMTPKLDTLQKHEGNRKEKKDNPSKGVSKGDPFVARDCRHQKNCKLFAARAPETILQQVNHINEKMRKKKRVQMATIFQILASGRPMVDYEERQELYEFLEVPEMPRMHWTDNSGWCMAEAMFGKVKEAVRAKVMAARFVALTCDEVTTVDNGSWISVHAYLVEDWTRTPMLLSVQRIVECASANNLTQILMEILASRGGLPAVAVKTKLVSFGADGANVFQGCHTGVCKKIQDKYAPFCQTVHCFAHKCNLAFKPLSKVPIVAAVEQLLNSTYAYFKHSPKRAHEFTKLAEAMDSRSLKLLRNVATRWVSILEPLKRLASQYRAVIAKMRADQHEELKAVELIAEMVDPYVLLAVTAIIPMMEALDCLVQFAQGRNVYIQDFIAAIRVCQEQLFKMYIDPATSFATDEHHNFRALQQLAHFDIYMTWDTDLNTSCERLAFLVNGAQVLAMSGGKFVDRAAFAAIGVKVKSECKVAAEKVSSELDRRFPTHEVLNALGILYPQYWLSEECFETFPHHLEIIKRFFCTPKELLLQDGLKQTVPALLDAYELEVEQSLFKLSMTSNCRVAMEPPYDMNPLTKIWRKITSNGPLAGRFPTYVALAEIAIVMVLGSVEDERTFSSVAFLKSKLRNSLDSHLNLVVGMYSQKMFSLKSFPYDATFAEWYNTLDRGRYGVDA